MLFRSLVHAQGPATRVPTQLKKLTATTPEAREAAFYQLREALVAPGEWFTASGPAAELLAQQAASAKVGRDVTLRLLGEMAAGDPNWFVGADAAKLRSAHKLSADTVRAATDAIPSAVSMLGHGEPEARAAAAFFLGGWIGQGWGWRTAFYALGFPGVVLAALVWMLPEPPRTTVVVEPPPFGPSLRALLRSPGLGWHLAGYALFAAGSYALSIWVPKLLELGRGMEKADVGLLAGGGSLVAGGLATAFGGRIADFWRVRHPGGRMRFAAACAAACAPLWLILLFAPGLVPAAIAYVLLLGLGLAWLGPAAADVVTIAGPEGRGLAIAVYLFVVNLVGYGAAPPLTGKVADALTAAGSATGARDALIAAPLCCAAASVLLWIGSRRVPAER